MKINLLETLGIMPELDDYPNCNQEHVNTIFWIAISWMLLLLALIWTLICASLDYSNISSAHLFQRSGAVLVAAATFVEIQFVINPRWFLEDTIRLEHGSFPRWDRFFKNSKRFQTLGWWMMILGTVTWAYGDLVI